MNNYQIILMHAQNYQIRFVPVPFVAFWKKVAPPLRCSGPQPVSTPRQLNFSLDRCAFDLSIENKFKKNVRKAFVCYSSTLYMCEINKPPHTCHHLHGKPQNWEASRADGPVCRIEAPNRQRSSPSLPYQRLSPAKSTTCEC